MTHQTTVTGRAGHYLITCECGWSAGWHRGIDRARAAGADHHRQRVRADAMTARRVAARTATTTS